MGASRHDIERSAAFERAVLPHADRLFRLAMWFECNRAGAEDVVRETMVQAQRSWLVAIYVHLEPGVPPKVLPLGIKPPVIPLFVLLLDVIAAIPAWKAGQMTLAESAGGFVVSSGSRLW